MGPSRYLTVLVIHPISFFEVINVVVPDPKTFFLILASAADATAVSTNSINAFLANDVRTFLANGKSIFNHGSRGLPRNPPDCMNS